MDRSELMGIHRKAIQSASHDESSLIDAVRDEGTLDHIIERCGSIDDPLERASGYLWCISNWHPFVEGNKRTSWLAAQASLDGKVIVCDDEEKFDRVIRSIAAGEIPENEIDGIFEYCLEDCSEDPVGYVLREQAELLRRLSG